MAVKSTLSDLNIKISNIGGISKTERELPPGVTVLAGENATNRTSFLKALCTGLGGELAQLKGDAAKGEITLEIDGETYTRELNRQGRGTVFEGTPYLTNEVDVKKAELFAFLMRDNAIRQCIRSGAGDLRDLLMEPVDTDAIEAEINDLMNEKRQLEADKKEAKQTAGNLSKLEQEHQQITNEIERLEDEIEELEAKSEEFEQTITEAEEENEDLRDAREKARTLRSKRSTLEEKIERHKDELEEVEGDLEALTRPEVDGEDLRDRKSALEDQHEDFDRELSKLRNEVRKPLLNMRAVISEVRDGSSGTSRAITHLASTGADLPEGSFEQLVDSESSEPTDQLLGSEAETDICLVCGSDVSGDRFETMDQQYSALIQTVDAQIQEAEAERREIEQELEEIKESLNAIAEFEAEKERLERRKVKIENDIPEFESELKSVEEELSETETEIRDLGAEENQELIEYHEELAQKQAVLSQKQARQEDIDAELATVEEKRQMITQYDSQIDEIDERLADLRGRVGELERTLRDEFNNQIDTVLDLLGYENLNQVEIVDRKEDVREGRRKVEKTVFDLKIVREGEEGAYRGSIEQLSESEQEILGLIVAFTGYLVHEVGSVCPVMVLDSVDTLDAGRLEGLLEYLGQHQDYVVAAVLPEEAAALSDSGAEFNIIEW